MSPNQYLQINLADWQQVGEDGNGETYVKGEEMPEEAAKVATYFFGPDGRHGEDYALFYNKANKANFKRKKIRYG